MRATVLVPALALALVAPVRAQSVLYDAGPAGTPPVAPSPVHQGWSEALTGSTAAGPLSPDPGAPVNAWQLNDPGPGEVRYERDVVWVGAPFDVELVMRPLAGALTLEIDTGDLITNSVFTLQLEVVGPDIYIHHGGATPLVCPGAADGAYHTFSFSGWNYWLAAGYDGASVGIVEETGWGLVVQGQGLRFGTFAGTHGRARVQRLEMTISGWGPIGTTYCAPAVTHSGGLSAHVAAEGIANWARNALRLRASDLPAGSFGFFLVGSLPASTPQAGGSQGVLCVGGNLGRFVGAGQVQNSGALGRMWVDVDLWYLPTSPNVMVMPGDTWHFQAWFRDANPQPTSNFTDAVALQF